MITPKLVAASYKYLLSKIEFINILQAVVEDLGYSGDKFSINNSSIQRIEHRIWFSDEIPDIVTDLWAERVLTSLNERSSVEELLPILLHWERRNNFSLR